MILLISYDLIGNERPKDYSRLIAAIEKHAGTGNYVRALYSQWFVDTNKTITEWNEIVKTATDSNDCRVIIRLYDKPTGRYSSSAVDWINTKFN